MGDRHDATLVVDALKMAVAVRGRRKMSGTIFHHDRGSEYTSDAFRTACRDLGVTQSSGRTGSCLDNAVAESFFATLKVELIHRLHLDTRAQARQAIFTWVGASLQPQPTFSGGGGEQPGRWLRPHRGRDRADGSGNPGAGGRNDQGDRAAKVAVGAGGRCMIGKVLRDVARLPRPG